MAPASDADRPRGSPPPDRATVVVDTQIALDLWVFRDPRADPLARALAAGRCQWAATAPMRAELAHVLQRPPLARWGVDPATALASFDRWAVIAPTPPTQWLLRCRDGSDQKFLDLALRLRAACLLTLDRDLLVVARRAARLGLLVTRPQDWAVLQDGAASADAP